MRYPHSKEYQDHIKRLAERARVSPEDYIDRILPAQDRLSSPGARCLAQMNLERVEQLTDRQWSHVDECPSCSALVGRLRPSVPEVQAYAEDRMLEQMGAPPLPSIPHHPRSARRSGLISLVRRVGLRRFAAAAIAIAIGIPSFVLARTAIQRYSRANAPLKQGRDETAREDPNAAEDHQRAPRTAPDDSVAAGGAAGGALNADRMRVTRNCGCPVCAELSQVLDTISQKNPLRLDSDPAQGDHAARDHLAAYLERKLPVEKFTVKKERRIPGSDRPFDVTVYSADDTPVAIFEIETREEISRSGGTKLEPRTANQWTQLIRICATHEPPISLHLVVPADLPKPRLRACSMADDFILEQADRVCSTGAVPSRAPLVAVWPWDR